MKKVSLDKLRAAIAPHTPPDENCSVNQQWEILVDTLMVYLKLDALTIIEESSETSPISIFTLIELGLFDHAHQCYLKELRKQSEQPSDGMGDPRHEWLRDPNASAQRYLDIYIRKMHHANQDIEAHLDEILPIIRTTYPTATFSRSLILERAKKSTNAFAVKPPR